MEMLQVLICVGILHAAVSTGPDEEIVFNWRVLFQVLDVNGDDLVNWQDAADSKARYVEMTSQRGEHNNGLANKLHAWWASHLLKLADEMTETEFVEIGSKLYSERGRAWYERFFKQGIDLIFHIHDTNYDNYMSWDEFKLIYRVFGLNVIGSDTEAFMEFDPEEKGIPEARFAAAWAGVIIGAHDIWTGVLKDRMILDGLE